MENYCFRYSFKQKDRLQYRILIAGQIKVESPVGDFRNPVGIEMQISQQILSEENETAVIAVTIDQVSSNVPIPEDQLPEIGKKSLMQMTPVGNVHWVEGAAAWQGAEYSMMRFPEEPLSVGNSWIQQVEDARGSASPFFTRYTFRGLDRKNRRLAEFRTELFTGHPEDPESVGAGSGRFCFNLDECWIESCENHIEYRFSMPFPQDPAQKIITHTVLQIDMERIR
jgi:hypothetical protein